MKHKFAITTLFTGLFVIAFIVNATQAQVQVRMTGGMGGAATQPDSGNGDPFEKIKVPLSSMINLGVNKNTLSLDKSKWPEDKNAQDANGNLIIGGGPGRVVIGGGFGNMFKGMYSPAGQFFTEIQTLIGARETNFSMINGALTQNFSGKGLNGSYSYGKDLISLTLEETVAQQRKITFSNTDTDELTLEMKLSKTATLKINQTVEGKITIDFTDETKPTGNVKLSADSFADLYQKNQTTMENVIYPILKKMGLGVEATIESEQLRQRALTLLVPISKTDEEIAAKLIKDLDADEFNVRDAATKALSKDFPKYKLAIFAANKNPDNSAEVTDRLTRLIENNKEKDSYTGIIQSLNLLENPVFLIRILAETGAEQKQTVTAQLEKATGQKFGADVEAWKKWLDEKQPKTNR